MQESWAEPTTLHIQGAEQIHKAFPLGLFALGFWALTPRLLGEATDSMLPKASPHERYTVPSPHIPL